MGIISNSIYSHFFAAVFQWVDLSVLRTSSILRYYENPRCYTCHDSTELFSVQPLAFIDYLVLVRD